MNVDIIESQYPIGFRKKDVEIIFEHLKHRHAVEIIGMKRVGINDFLKFLFYKPGLIDSYLGQNNNELFIYIDLNDLLERELFSFWRLLLKRIADISEKSEKTKMISKGIKTLFLSNIQTNDYFLTIEAVRTALDIISESNINTTIFFNHFDRLKDVFSREFFYILQGIKEQTSNKTNFVFTSYRPLEELVGNNIEKWSLSLFTQKKYFRIANFQDREIILLKLIKYYELNLSDELKNEILEYSGGHVYYLQLITSILNEQKNMLSTFGNSDLETLFNDERLELLSEEIFESLNPNEKEIVLKLSKNIKVDKDILGQQKYLNSTGIILNNEYKSPSLFSKIFSIHLQKIIKKNIYTKYTLTRKEMMMYNLLVDNLNKITERDKIIESVWPECKSYTITDWSIDRLVARLRKKLILQNSTYTIETIRTRGFMMLQKY